MRVELHFGSCRLQGTSVHGFLRLAIDARFNRVAHANATLAAIRGPSLAIRQLARMSWGSSSGTLLHSHNTLTLSRIC